MSNKKRSSRRQLKISIRPNDHVMSNLSQKKDVIDNSDNIEEIKVGDAGHVLEKDQIKDTYMEKEGGVSGNTDYDVHTETTPIMEGIGAIASGLGTPLRMDTMTAQMCREGVGQIEFARVLVEFDLEKGFKNVIDIHYKDKQNKTKGKKSVMVKYQWKPGICSHCKVFGHSIGKCDKRPRTVEEIEIAKKKEQSNENMTYRDGFRDVFRKNRNFQGKVNSTFNKYQIREEQIKAIKTTANKYVVLSQNELEEKSELNMLKDRIIVDQYLNQKLQPSLDETTLSLTSGGSLIEDFSFLALQILSSFRI
ncbi:RNA-directed DNA polymerase, eukaryota, reverse transcriptase zinc-binding domain protein [Tanacetum coccineum]